MLYSLSETKSYKPDHEGNAQWKQLDEEKCDFGHVGGAEMRAILRSADPAGLSLERLQQAVRRVCVCAAIDWAAEIDLGLDVLCQRSEAAGKAALALEACDKASTLLWLRRFWLS